MDRHVAEDPARHLEIVERRNGWIAARDDELLQRPDLARPDRRCQRCVARVVAPVEADLHLDAAAGDLPAALLHPGHVEIDRLLAEYMLAGPGRRGDQPDMGVGGGGDQHRLDRAAATTL